MRAQREFSFITSCPFTFFLTSRTFLPSQNLLSSRTPNNPFLERALARRERDQPSYLDAVRQRWFQEICCRVIHHGAFEGVVDHWDEIGVGTKEGGESRPLSVPRSLPLVFADPCFLSFRPQHPKKNLSEEPTCEKPASPSGTSRPPTKTWRRKRDLLSSRPTERSFPSRMWDYSFSLDRFGLGGSRR